MRELEWLRDPSSLPAKPVYVIHGEDLYLKRESLQTVVRTVAGERDGDAAVTRFEGNSASLADILDELRMLPFFSKQRVVVVNEADSFVTRHRKDIEGYVEAPSATGILILLVKAWPSNTKLARLVEGTGL